MKDLHKLILLRWFLTKRLPRWDLRARINQ